MAQNPSVSLSVDPRMGGGSIPSGHVPVSMPPQPTGMVVTGDASAPQQMQGVPLTAIPAGGDIYSSQSIPFAHHASGTAFQGDLHAHHVSGPITGAAVMMGAPSSTGMNGNIPSAQSVEVYAPMEAGMTTYGWQTTSNAFVPQGGSWQNQQQQGSLGPQGHPQLQHQAVPQQQHLAVSQQVPQQQHLAVSQQVPQQPLLVVSQQVPQQLPQQHLPNMTPQQHPGISQQQLQGPPPPFQGHPQPVLQNHQQQLVVGQSPQQVQGYTLQHVQGQPQQQAQVRPTQQSQADAQNMIQCQGQMQTQQQNRALSSSGFDPLQGGRLGKIAKKRTIVRSVALGEGGVPIQLQAKVVDGRVQYAKRAGDGKLVQVSHVVGNKRPHSTQGELPGSHQLNTSFRSGRAGAADASRLGSSPDELEEGDNFLTTINELCQKGVASLCAPKYQYEQISQPGNGSKWKCIATTAAKGPADAEAVTFSTEVFGKNKKDTRRLAAKKLLMLLLEQGVLTQDAISSKGPANPPTSTPAPVAPVPQNGMSAAMLKECAEAVSILNQLWQKGRFLCKHKFTNHPVSSGANGRWRCSLFIKTRGQGDIEVSHEASQIKQARAIAAYMAVERLKEMNFPGLDQINVHSKTQKNVSKDAPNAGDDSSSGSNSEAEGEGRGGATSNEPAAEANAIGEAVDAATRARHPEFGGEFVVPEGVTVVIAESAADCNSWVAENVSDGTKLGLYIDSTSARGASRAFAKKAGIDVNTKEFVDDDCRAICFATGRSVLLACAHRLGSPNPKLVAVKEEAREVGDISNGGTNLDTESTDAAQTEGVRATNGLAKSWIPQSVKMLLERREFAKVGTTLKEGVIVLRLFHGIVCRGVRELGIASVALLGSNVDSRALEPRPHDLARDWLRQRFDPYSEACLSSAAGLTSLVSSTRDVIAQAIPVTLAASMIESRMMETAESRKRKRYSNTDEYLELCNRLCTQPTKPAPIVL